MIGNRSSTSTKKNQYYSELVYQSSPAYVRQQARLSLEREVTRPNTPQTSARTLFDFGGSHKTDKKSIEHYGVSYEHAHNRITWSGGSIDKNKRNAKACRNRSKHKPHKRSTLSSSTRTSVSQRCKKEEARNCQEEVGNYGTKNEENKESENSAQGELSDDAITADWNRLFVQMATMQSWVVEGELEFALDDCDELFHLVDQHLALVERASSSAFQNKVLGHSRDAICLLHSCAASVGEQHDPLLLRLARLLLSFSCNTGHKKFLEDSAASAIRLVFKLSKNKVLDTEFRSTGVLGMLINLFPLDLTGDSSPLMPSPDANWKNHEALLYVTATIKFLSNSNSNQRFLVQRAVVQRICTLMESLVLVLHQSLDPQKREMLGAQVGYVFVQLLTTLRNMALDKKHIPQFEKANVMNTICEIAGMPNIPSEVVLHCSRLISKLSQLQNGRQLIALEEKSPATIAKLIQESRDSVALVRLCYSLGNLVAGNPVNRATFGTPEIMDSLGALVQRWSRKLLSNNLETKLPEPAEENVHDLVAKVSRCIANLALDANAVHYLSNVHGIRCIASLVNHDAVLASEFKSSDDFETTKKYGEFIFNTLAALTNLSYHWKEDQDVSWVIDSGLLSNVTGFLLNGIHAPPDCLHEAIRVLGNVTRIPSLHEHLGDLNADRIMLIFLEHCDQAIALDACGVLVNLSCSKQTRETLLQDSGAAVDGMLDLFREAASDFPMLAVSVCKVLFNAFCQSEFENVTQAESKQDMRLGISIEEDICEVLNEEICGQEAGSSLKEKLQYAIGVLAEAECSDESCDGLASRCA